MAHSTRVSVWRGDITDLACDAIVNAAKRSLLGGGGVDGAIHQAAGPQLLAACRLLDGCETGQAKLTPGFNLPARYVIHTVGPVWRGGQEGEAELLASCYRTSIALALAHGLRTVAFPSISTGIYGYPIAAAAAIAVAATRAAVLAQPELTLTHVCFSEADAAIYRRALADVWGDQVEPASEA